MGSQKIRRSNCVFRLYTIGNYVSIFLFGQFGPVETFTNEFQVFIRPFSSGHFSWQIFTTVAHAYASAAIVLPIVILILLCSIFTKQFHHLNQKFKQCIDNKGQSMVCLAQIRRQHQCLSKSVFLSDDIFSFWLAVFSGVTVLIVCLGLYELVIDSSVSSFGAKSTVTFWVVAVAANIWICGSSRSQSS